ncbi:MAG: endonuclease/exonuclease/phosphatase family metal-dependent hydrolase [Myxococcota bacterium]|jgi:endonuclease/exonuclease/phosphatase family metal-dependent hydrolase
MRMFPLALVLVLGCGGGKDADSGKNATTTATFATYNAGLAISFVTAARARLPHTAEAIGAIDADIVCLQEVWEPDQVAAVAAAATDFPHQFWPDASQITDPEPGCTPAEIESLSTCLDLSCPDVCPDELVTCFLERCGFTFLGLSATCQSCVMANVGDDPDALLAACEEEEVKFAYGGSYGTGILSKHPLSEPVLEVLESTTNRRGVLHTVADVNGVDVDVYCTHLTANLYPLPYTGTAEDWAAEQGVQVDSMLAYIEATRTSGNPMVLMGDMNNGPATGDAPATLPANWAKLSATGWEIPWVATGECTMCADNTLRGDDAVSYLIDHVLLDGFDVDSSERIIDGTTSIENCGEPLDAAYSDHYGVSVTATSR